MPLYRRIPKRGFTCRNSKTIVGINLSALEVFEDGATVSVETLIESGIVKNPKDGVMLRANTDILVNEPPVNASKKLNASPVCCAKKF